MNHCHDNDAVIDVLNFRGDELNRGVEVDGGGKAKAGCDMFE